MREIILIAMVIGFFSMILLITYGWPVKTLEAPVQTLAIKKTPGIKLGTKKETKSEASGCLGWIGEFFSWIFFDILFG